MVKLTIPYNIVEVWMFNSIGLVFPLIFTYPNPSII